MRFALEGAIRAPKLIYDLLYEIFAVLEAIGVKSGGFVDDASIGPYRLYEFFLFTHNISSYTIY